jgi:hypothetical protein
MVISRLVKFEFLLELKIKQKQGTSRNSPCYKDATSLKQQYGLSIPVIYFDIREWFHSDLAGYIWVAGRFLKRHMRCIREEDNKSNNQVIAKLLIQMSLLVLYIS